MFKYFYNPLCNFAASILKDDSMAQDVVQDVFTHLWERKDIVSIERDGKNYLFTAVKNKSIEKLRKKSTEAQLVQTMKLLNETPIKKQIDNYLLREQINNSIRQLPPKCQNIFVLSKQNGLTYQEIADELNISVKTVENQIGKAYRVLRDLLAGSVKEIYS